MLLSFDACRGIYRMHAAGMQDVGVLDAHPHVDALDARKRTGRTGRIGRTKTHWAHEDALDALDTRRRNGRTGRT